MASFWCTLRSGKSATAVSYWLLAAAALGVLVGCGGGSPEATLGPGLTFSALTSMTSSAQNITLTNTGSSSLQLQQVAITGPNAANFAQTSACPKQLAPGASCAIAITFTAQVAGLSTASLTVTDNATDGAAQSAALVGNAVAPAPVVSLSSPSLSFGGLTAGAVSTPQTVTLSNSGNAALAIASISVVGADANLFAQTSTCGATVAVGASCTISATFAPKIAGSYAAAITLTDNAATTSQTVGLTGTAAPAALSIDTSNPSDWKISNGTLSVDWNSLHGNIFGMFLAGHPDNLVDTTHTSGGQPQGFYMDNSGLGGGAATATYTNAGTYLDWSITTPSGPANAYTYTEHFIMTPNDPGFHVYFVANHAATDIAGGIGQIQWVFRDNLTQFDNTYSVDPSVNSPGPTAVPLPLSSEMFSTDPGRAVQDATVDLHGLPVPAGYTRQFYTKYDFAGYEYLHKAHGLYGGTYGVWTVLPSQETMVGGPTKQDLYFTGNLLMIEAYSNHEDNGLSLTTPAGTASSRLFGPFYVHFNTFGQAYTSTGNVLASLADMYADALQAGAGFRAFYDTEQQLLASGYVPSTDRGSVSVQVAGVAGAPHTAWAVLSDPAKNFQYSSSGSQYWADLSASGSATITGVAPGTYRLSVFALGQWGELRKDNIVVQANQNVVVPAQPFIPENFGTEAPVFTVGTADRSAHEFLHGHDANGFDDREFWGAWNYWEDFGAGGGAVIYNATNGPAGPATNDLSKWNYVHWGAFDPGLYGGVYSTGDDTTDGYKDAIPAYVAALPAASGTNGITTKVPPWQVHFATPQTQSGSTAAKYVVLSVSLACTEASDTVTLNGQTLSWPRANPSDCMVRSGLSGYQQWFALQWDASILNPPGQDNLLTITPSQTDGVSDDALRLELTDTSADPATRGWNDYEFVDSSTDTKVQDGLPNP